MATVGIFFGTDTGKTRKAAKQIYAALGQDTVAKPLNINKASLDDLMAFDCLIVGTPTLGSGQLPGLECDCQEESWAEFIPLLAGANLLGKKVAVFGLGDQVSYGDEFVNGLGELYDAFADTGATMVGDQWSSDGYEFNASNALDDDHFVGLVLDDDNQSDLSADRIAQWVAILKPEFGL